MCVGTHKQAHTNEHKQTRTKKRKLKQARKAPSAPRVRKRHKPSEPRRAARGRRFPAAGDVAGGGRALLRVRGAKRRRRVRLLRRVRGVVPPRVPELRQASGLAAGRDRVSTRGHWRRAALAGRRGGRLCLRAGTSRRPVSGRTRSWRLARAFGTRRATTTCAAGLVRLTGRLACGMCASVCSSHQRCQSCYHGTRAHVRRMRLQSGMSLTALLASVMSAWSASCQIFQRHGLR